VIATSRCDPTGEAALSTGAFEGLGETLAEGLAEHGGSHGWH
jgi:NAD(P)-dependent dehydrogenase (short-subunit alcohol dehydrogenase family)